MAGPFSSKPDTSQLQVQDSQAANQELQTLALGSTSQQPSLQSQAQASGQQLQTLASASGSQPPAPQPGAQASGQQLQTSASASGSQPPAPQPGAQAPNEPRLSAYQSFWSVIPEVTGPNPLTYQIGHEGRGEKWENLIKLLEIIRDTPDDAKRPDFILDQFVQSNVWDVSAAGFDLKVLKGPDVLTKVPQLLCQELDVYEREHKIDWDAAKFQRAKNIIKNVFGENKYHKYFIDLADTAASWSEAGHNIAGGIPPQDEDSENESDSDSDSDRMDLDHGDGYTRSTNYGVEKVLLESVTSEDRKFYTLLHPYIYEVYHKLHGAFEAATEHSASGSDWTKLTQSIPEIQKIQDMMKHDHEQPGRSKNFSTSAYHELLSDWEYFWSNSTVKDFKSHLEQLWKRESFPKTWINLPLSDKPPALTNNELPKKKERKEEWIRFYGCDPTTGELGVGTEQSSITTSQQPDEVTRMSVINYPELVVGQRPKKIPPPTQGSKNWLVKQSIPSYGFKSQVIRPGYTEDGHPIVAYKGYPQVGYDSTGQRLIRRVFVVEKKLANNCIQYLLESQVDSGGPGVWKSLDEAKIPAIDSIPKVGDSDLHQGDWIREHSDPPWEIPWVAMSPESTWDTDTIPTMAVCFRFTIDGQPFTAVFHRTLLNKYIPAKAVEKAILRCFGQAHMPSLKEFMRQYHAQRRFLDPSEDYGRARKAIGYLPQRRDRRDRERSRSRHRSRHRSRQSSRQNRHVRFASDDDDSSSSDEDYTNESSDSDEDPYPRWSKNRSKRSRPRRANSSSRAASGLQAFQEQLDAQRELIEQLSANVSRVLTVSQGRRN